MQSSQGVARTTPTDFVLHESGQRLAHGARESSDQRNAGDGVARAMSVEPNQRCEGGFVKATAHSDSKNDPCTEQTFWPLRFRQRRGLAQTRRRSRPTRAARPSGRRHDPHRAQVAHWSATILKAVSLAISMITIDKRTSHYCSCEPDRTDC